MTINTSSGGIAFTCDRQLPVNSNIQISISWPVALDNSCPLRLVIWGRVVRSDGTCAACTIDKSEFRTQARSGLDGFRQVLSSAVGQQVHVYV